MSESPGVGRRRVSLEPLGAAQGTVLPDEAGRQRGGRAAKRSSGFQRPPKTPNGERAFHSPDGRSRAHKGRSKTPTRRRRKVRSARADRRSPSRSKDTSLERSGARAVPGSADDRERRQSSDLVGSSRTGSRPRQQRVAARHRAGSLPSRGSSRSARIASGLLSSSDDESDKSSSSDADSDFAPWGSQRRRRPSYRRRSSARRRRSRQRRGNGGHHNPRDDGGDGDESDIGSDSRPETDTPTPREPGSETKSKGSGFKSAATRLLMAQAAMGGSHKNMGGLLARLSSVRTTDGESSGGEGSDTGASVATDGWDVKKQKEAAQAEKEARERRAQAAALKAERQIKRKKYLEQQAYMEAMTNAKTGAVKYRPRTPDKVHAKIHKRKSLHPAWKAVLFRDAICWHPRKSLNFEGYNMSDFVLERALSVEAVGKALESLAVRGLNKQVSSDLWMSLPDRTPNLKSLDLQGSVAVSDDVVAHITRYIPSLETLILAQCSARALTSKALQQMAPMYFTHLRRLALRACPGVSDLSLQGIARNFGLTSVDLSGCTGVTDTGVMGILRGCTGLRELRIANCPRVTGDLALATMVPAKVFKLGGGDASTVKTAPTSADGDGAATARSGLRTARTARTTQTGRSLGGMETSRTALTTATGSTSRRNRIPVIEWVSVRALQVIDLSYLKVTDSGLQSISTVCKLLRELKLVGCFKITGHGLAALAVRCASLTVLDLSNCEQLGDWDINAYADAASRGIAALEAGFKAAQAATVEAGLRGAATGGSTARSYGAATARSAGGSRPPSGGIARRSGAVTARSGLLTGRKSAMTARSGKSHGEAGSKRPPTSTSGPGDAEKGGDSLGLILEEVLPPPAPVQRLLLNGCHKITDAGLLGVAKRCRNVQRLQMRGLNKLSDIGLGHFVKYCTGITSLHVTGRLNFNPGNVADTKYAAMRAAAAAVRKRERSGKRNGRGMDADDEAEEDNDAVAEEAAEALAKLAGEPNWSDDTSDSDAEMRDLAAKAAADDKRLGKRKHAAKVATFYGVPRVTGVAVAALLRAAGALQVLDLANCALVDDDAVAEIIAGASDFSNARMAEYQRAVERQRKREEAEKAAAKAAKEEAECKAKIVAERRRKRLAEMQAKLGVDLDVKKRGNKHGKSVAQTSASSGTDTLAAKESKVSPPRAGTVEPARPTSALSRRPSLASSITETREMPVLPVDSLTTLELSGCPLTDDAMLTLSGWSALKQLSVSHCDFITDVGVRALAAGCTALTSLTVRDCRDVGDSAVAALAEHCTKLQRLDISGCWEVSDEGIYGLGVCKDLEFVACDKCYSVTPGGADALAKRLPLGIPAKRFLGVEPAPPMTRDFIKSLRAQQAAAKMMQVRYRMYMIRKQGWEMRIKAAIAEGKKRERGATELQRIVRGKLARNLLAAMRAEFASNEEMQQNRAVRKIQRMLRGAMARAMVTMYRMARRLRKRFLWNRVLRGTALLRFENTYAAAVDIQAGVRGMLTRIWYKEEKHRRWVIYESRRIGATEMQRIVRGKLARVFVHRFRIERDQKYRRQIRATTLMAAVYRGYVGRREAGVVRYQAMLLHKRKEAAAASFQRVYKYFRFRVTAMRRFRMMKWKAMKIQALYRSVKEREERRYMHLYVDYVHPPPILLTYPRSMYTLELARKVTERRHAISQAAIPVQRTARAYIFRKLLRDFKKEQARIAEERRVAATRIQCCWRAHVAWRIVIRLRLERDMGALLNRWARGRLGRLAWLQERQAQAEARQMMEDEQPLEGVPGGAARFRFVRRKGAATVIATWWRILITPYLEVRRWRHRRHDMAVRIQSAYRACRGWRWFRLLRTAKLKNVLIIQRFMRQCLTRLHWLKAIRMIRAKKAREARVAKAQKASYLVVKEKLMQVNREETEAALVVQRRFRGFRRAKLQTIVMLREQEADVLEAEAKEAKRIADYVRKKTKKKHRKLETCEAVKDLVNDAYRAGIEEEETAATEHGAIIEPPPDGVPGFRYGERVLADDGAKLSDADVKIRKRIREAAIKKNAALHEVFLLRKKREDIFRIERQLLDNKRSAEERLSKIEKGVHKFGEALGSKSVTLMKAREGLRREHKKWRHLHGVSTRFREAVVERLKMNNGVLDRGEVAGLLQILRDKLDLPPSVWDDSEKMHFRQDWNPEGIDSAQGRNWKEGKMERRRKEAALRKAQEEAAEAAAKLAATRAASRGRDRSGVLQLEDEDAAGGAGGPMPALEDA